MREYLYQSIRAITGLVIMTPFIITCAFALGAIVKVSVRVFMFMYNLC